MDTRAQLEDKHALLDRKQKEIVRLVGEDYDEQTIGKQLKCAVHEIRSAIFEINTVLGLPPQDDFPEELEQLKEFAKARKAEASAASKGNSDETQEKVPEEVPKASSRQVRLPNGKKVTISDVPGPSWFEQGATGYIDPILLAPDPKNPRRRLNKARFAALCASVASSGVKDPLIITPMSKAPWVKVAREHASRPFVIVSGFRRSRAAIKEGVGAVPYQVELFPSSKLHRLDASLHNKHRDDPTPLDEGYDIIQLRDEEGWGMDELAAHFGYKTTTSLYSRINLTRLDPTLQDLLELEDGNEGPLSTSVGGILGGVKAPTPEELDGLFETFNEIAEKAKLVPSVELEEMSEDDLRFLLQKLLYAVIVARSLKATNAMGFIKDRTLRLSSSRLGANSPQTNRFKPSRRKDRLVTCISGVNASEIIDWSVADWARTFELSSHEDVDEVLIEAKKASEFLNGLVKKLEHIKGGKKPTHPDVLKAMHTAKKA